MKKIKALIMGWAIAIALVFAGCVKVDQTLTFDKNGKGTLEMRYGMAEQTIAQLEAMEQMAASMGQTPDEATGDNMPFDFDEARIREEFEAERPEGVELVSLSSETVNGWRYVNMRLSFETLSALSQTELFSDAELSLTKNADGNYVLVQTTGSDDRMPSGPADPSNPAASAMMEQMAGMFAGMRIVTTVVAPTDVIESNATERNGRQASWVFDVDEDPSALTKLQGTNLRLVFDGKGVEIPEFGAP
jgi:hypothetical protein